MTELVGIVNITPDSFSDGGQFFEPQVAIDHAGQLFKDGASLVDIGGESTRPGATPLTAQQEWQRLEPVVRVLLPLFPGRISLDSHHAQTVRRAFAIGPVIVNDVTGLNDPAMVAAVVELNAKLIISHLPDMDIQKAHQLTPVTTVAQVRRDLLAKADLLQSKGLSRQQIVLDPGIGFGKTAQVNQQLLKFAAQVPDYQVMIGYSRKRFLGPHRMDLEPNLQAGRTARASGARYLRVHDVAGHRQLLSSYKST
jgi:dihydropteroate synthase